MERWELITVLVIISTSILLLFFYCVFEYVVQNIQDLRHPGSGPGARDPKRSGRGNWLSPSDEYVQLGQLQDTISFGRRRNPQMKHLLNDPYR